MQEERQSIAEKEDAEEEDQLDDAVRLAFEKGSPVSACWSKRRVGGLGYADVLLRSLRTWSTPGS
jgi:hypothetical protein